MNQNTAIIEIRPAAGGDESRIWASDLLRMYMRFAQAQNWKAVLGDGGTIKITGQGAYVKLQHETGVHRVQRIPKTEKRGRVHTSTATVAVLPEMSEQEVQISQSDLDWQFFRSGGHGGQNVNKVSSAVRLTHKPTGIVVTSSRERHQQANRQIALELMAGKLYQLAEEKRRGLAY